MSSGEVPSKTPGLRSLVLRGGVALYARQLASMGLSLIGVFIVTRIIGPEAYGSYTTALSISQYSQILVLTGVTAFLVRHAGDLSPRQYHVASTFLLAISLFLVLCLEVGASFLGEWVQIPQFPTLLRVLALNLPLQFLAAVAGTRFDRALNFRIPAAIELTGQVAYYVAAVPMAYLDYGPWSLVAGWFAQHIVLFTLFHAASRYVFVLAWDSAFIREMVHYSFQFSLPSWLWQLRSLVNPLMIGHFLGAEAVAYVALTVRLMELLAVIKTITWRLSLAAFGRIQNDQQKLTAAITEGMQLQTLAIGPALLAGMWLGPLIAIPFIGERWAAVFQLFPFVAIGVLTNAQFNMHMSALQVTKHSYQVAAFSAVNVLLFVLGCTVGINHLGLLAYGWAEVVALPSYYILHRAVVQIIGRPKYHVALIWWGGIAAGLFFYKISWYAIFAPFAALFFPSSIRQIVAYYSSVIGRSETQV